MQKQRDLLREFASLRDALQQERRQIQSRLQEIDSVFGETGVQATPAVLQPRPTPAQPAAAARAANRMSLREAIARATAKEPLKVREIVDTVQKLGYTFQSSNPVNSVGAYLYGPEGKKHFKGVDGRFGPIGSSPASAKNADNGAPAKRTMSPEARKRIAAAQRARWAKLKKK